MAIDKMLLAGSTSLLLLKLLSERDMYGYQMVAALKERSEHTFDLKAGTLYPLLHGLEQKGYVEARNEAADGGRLQCFDTLRKMHKSILLLIGTCSVLSYYGARSRYCASAARSDAASSQHSLLRA